MATLQQQPEERLSDQNRRHRVCVQHAQHGGARVAAKPDLARADAGVIDQQIEPVGLRAHRIDGRLQLGLARDFQRNQGQLLRVLGRKLRQLIAVRRTRRCKHPRALVYILPYQLQPKAPVRTGNKNSHAHVLSLQDD